MDQGFNELPQTKRDATRTGSFIDCRLVKSHPLLQMQLGGTLGGL